MRIYSNTRLCLPNIIHTLHASMNTPVGRWDTLYFFHVQSVKPLTLKTSACIELLQENRKYYCYDKIYRNKSIEILGNISDTISYNMDTDNNNNIHVYIPKLTSSNDIIIVRDDTSYEYPTLHVPSWLKFYSPNIM